MLQKLHYHQKRHSLLRPKKTIASSEQELATKTEEFQQKQQEYQTAFADFTEKQQEYQSALKEITSWQAALDTHKNALSSAKQQYETAIASCTQNVNALKEQLINPDLSQEERDALNQKLTDSEAELAKI